MEPTPMDGKFMLKAAADFRDEISQAKKLSQHNHWYPYDTLSNFIHLKDFFDEKPLNELIDFGSAILDIGAADGEIAFLFEKLGFKPTVIDFGPTNFNNLIGIKELSKILESKVQIFDFDLDDYGSLDGILPNPVSLTFFLGIHYHLKNPFLVLDFLAKKTEYLFISTRISRYTVAGYEMKKEALTYLLNPTELNNDPTNYWVFSETAILRLFERTGFEVLKFKCVGDVNKSRPNDMQHDERLFALLKSNNLQRSH